MSFRRIAFLFLFCFLGLISTHPAEAQIGPLNPLTCTTNISVIPTLRAEGYTERIADIIFTCSGGAPAGSGVTLPTATFQLLFGGHITNRLYANGWSDALLTIDEPGSGLPGATATQLACAATDGNCPILSTGTAFGNYDGSPGRPNVFPGKVSSNSITFANIPIAATGDANTTRVFRFSNILVN